jgi:hypothetical protein
MSVGKSDRILVTGGAGFLGGFVMDKLRDRGFTDVVTFRRKDYDITREAEVERLYADTRPAAVMHLAAEVGGIGANRDNPGRFFFANMAMGMHLIEGARRHGVKKFVQTGTICAYPNHTPVPFREEELWNGFPEVTNAPYGIAKKALLMMCQSYRQQYGLNAIYLLPVNLYGPKDNFHLHTSHVIPALIRKCVQARLAGRRDDHGVGDGRGQPGVFVRGGLRRGAGQRDGAVRLAGAGEPRQRAGDHDPRPDAAGGEARPVRGARSSGTPASPTASPGGAWTSPARGTPSASAPARALRTASARPSNGSKPTWTQSPSGRSRRRTRERDDMQRAGSRRWRARPDARAERPVGQWTGPLHGRTCQPSPRRVRITI